MDFINLKPDKLKLLDKHYTPGRGGKKIDKIIIHHNAANLTTEGVYTVWQTRRASAHYQVEKTGVIGQLVRLSDTAWHARDKWEINQTSIAIEHANIQGKAPWAVSGETLQAGAKLTAALCHKYQLGTPTWGVNVYPHKHFQATQCPGELAASQQKAYMDAAVAFYKQLAVSQKPQQKKDLQQIAKEVMAGRWGNDPERSRRLIAAGYPAKEIQKLVDQLKGKWQGQTPKPGDTVRLTKRSTIYETGKPFSSWCYDPSVVFTLHSVKNGRAVLERKGTIIGATNVNYLTKVN